MHAIQPVFNDELLLGFRDNQLALHPGNNVYYHGTVVDSSLRVDLPYLLDEVLTAHEVRCYIGSITGECKYGQFLLR